MSDAASSCPPPPPPPPPPAPPPLSPPDRVGEGRNALLTSIQTFSKGKLKKTETTDRINPVVWLIIIYIWEDVATRLRRDCGFSRRQEHESLTLFLLCICAFFFFFLNICLLVYIWCRRGLSLHFTSILAPECFDTLTATSIWIRRCELLLLSFSLNFCSLHLKMDHAHVHFDLGGRMLPSYWKTSSKLKLLTFLHTINTFWWFVAVRQWAPPPVLIYMEIGTRKQELLE